MTRVPNLGGSDASFYPFAIRDDVDELPESWCCLATKSDKKCSKVPFATLDACLPIYVVNQAATLWPQFWTGCVVASSRSLVGVPCP